MAMLLTRAGTYSPWCIRRLRTHRRTRRGARTLGLLGASPGLAGARPGARMVHGRPLTVGASVRSEAVVFVRRARGSITTCSRKGQDARKELEAEMNDRVQECPFRRSFLPYHTVLYDQYPPYVVQVS